MGHFGFDFSAARFLFFFCVFLSIIFPAKLQFVKLPILCLILFFCFSWMSRAKFDQKINKIIVFFSLAFSFIGCFWSFYGSIVGNPGALSVVNVMVFYPAIFSFISFLLFPGDFVRIERFFLICCVSVVFYQSMYLFSASGLDGGKFFDFNQRFFGDVANGFQTDTLLSFSLPNVAALLFFMPFFALNAFCSKKVDAFSVILVSIMIFLAFASGRRGLYVSFSISFIFCVFLVVFSGVRTLKTVMLRFFSFSAFIIFFMVFVFSSGFLDFENTAYEVYSIVDFSSNESNLERKYQFDALYSGFESHPFLGNGAGAVAEYVRSIDQPWAYELFYVSMLFQYGIIGFSFYFFGVIFLVFFMIFLSLSKKIDDDGRFFVIKLLSGFLSFLIASSTNPYLAKFDYMWVIFIPVAIVNCYLVHRKV